MTEKDEMIILPSSMAHDIRNNTDLGFNPFIAKVSICMPPHHCVGLVQLSDLAFVVMKTFHAGIHGFEPLAENVSHDLLVDMVKSKLTPAISTYSSN